jgi:hypothetical protein
MNVRRHPEKISKACSTHVRDFSHTRGVSTLPFGPFAEREIPSITVRMVNFLSKHYTRAEALRSGTGKGPATGFDGFGLRMYSFVYPRYTNQGIFKLDYSLGLC